jgi:hypothetical protein
MKESELFLSRIHLKSVKKKLLYVGKVKSNVSMAKVLVTTR